MKKISKVLMIVAAFSFVALLISCSSNANSPAGVSKSFIKKVEKGDVTEAVKMLEVAEKGSDEEIQKMEAFLSEGSKEMKSKGGVKKIEVISETISDDGMKADVVLKVTYENGEEDESSTKLKKTDKGWKITMGK